MNLKYTSFRSDPGPMQFFLTTLNCSDSVNIQRPSSTGTTQNLTRAAQVMTEALFYTVNPPGDRGDQNRRAREPSALASRSSDWVPHALLSDVGDKFSPLCSLPGVPKL